MKIDQKAKIGVLWIAAERFCPLGEGMKDGTYPKGNAWNAGIIFKN